MSLTLPENLFTSHRLTEEPGQVFRLQDSYRAALLTGCNLPLPAGLPAEPLPPMQEISALAHHLNGLMAHFIRLDNSRALLDKVIERIFNLTRQSADGCLAAILLQPYQYYTAHHAINCALLAALTARNLQLDEKETRTVVAAALTMNMGSADIQNQMAHQETPPTTLQRQTLNIHPILSSAMLREAGEDDPLWHEIVLLHHERKDGHGYTFGMRDADIPRLAHLLHLLDIVTAKLMPRSYRGSVAPKIALVTLYSGTQEQFDPHITAQLIKVLGIYPPGSFIELENGDRALVIRSGQNAASPLAVTLGMFRHEIDTAKPGYHVRRGISMNLNPQQQTIINHYWS
jgi:HD-GYP domain-containing protein (c-di-GMP phosphodiesterase class II)